MLLFGERMRVRIDNMVLFGERKRVRIDNFGTGISRLTVSSKQYVWEVPIIEDLG